MATISEQKGTTMDLPLEMQKERITKDNSMNWRGRVLGVLTKRDTDDLTRISVKVGQASMIRYFAAHYIDPMFVTAAEEKAFRAFGEKIEAAYHDFLAALTEARAAQK